MKTRDLTRAALLALLLPEALRRAVDAALARGSRPHEVLILASRRAPGGLAVAVGAYLDLRKGA